MSDERRPDRDDVESAGIPTDTRSDGGVGSVGGVSGVGLVGTDFGIAGNVPEPPGVDEEPVMIEDADDPDAMAHRGESGDDSISPSGVGPEVRPPS
ncbi:hypothetical protein [Agromyces sp. Marseille-P2726]|uniref:hypothetical protein n=1 Tax=Agromyces sp. Marseille-P2726 TaxID=2709132 RepID=UPI00156E8E44|nr:hypothetical protein [Agromyces sp. Marseille-P2726]